MKGQTVSHYRIGTQLGVGGMGVVYAAEDVRLGRAVAVKFLAPELVHDATALERFRREARSASGLNHPHICTIYDVGEHGQQHFIVMELLEGRTLREVLGGGPLELPLLLRLGVQIADALDAAHGRGIIHRDIKPANIFVTSPGNAKILDFGLAKLSREIRLGSIDRGQRSTRSDDVRTLTVEGMPLGTVAYMSPEQARGETLDGRTDLFSLGAVVYEMATGRPAFPGTTDAIVFDGILHRQPVTASQFNPDLPPGLDTVVSKALEKDRRLRYQTAGDIKADLLRLERDAGPHYHDQDPGTPVRQLEPERARGAATSRFLPAAAAFFVLAIAAIVAVVWKTEQAPILSERDRILLADVANETGEPVFDDTLERAIAFQLEQSPYLNLVPETQVAETLRFMGRQPSEAITGRLAHEICERENIAALISGSIARLGSTYVIHVDATNCRSGEALAREQAEADKKEQVLRAVGGAVTRLRGKLGETLASVERFDTPIEQATTPSLAALRAYTAGHLQVLNGRQGDSIPLFKQAIALDPDFALAYARLSTVYANLEMTEEAIDAARQAFRRAGRVSERERLYITLRYHSVVTGDVDRYRAALEVYSQTYAHDPIPLINLGDLLMNLGQFADAIDRLERARRLNPRHRTVYDNLVEAYLGVGRFEEAAATLREQMKHTQETAYTHVQSSTIAFARGDFRLFEQERQWLRDRNDTIRLQNLDARTFQFLGRFREARELIELGVQRDLARGDRRGAALRLTSQAAREAVVGNKRETRRLVERALALATGPVMWESAALPLALAGDVSRATSLLDRCLPHFRSHTEYNAVYIPRDRAAVALARGDPTDALNALQPAAAYELGKWAGYWIVYLRGAAYHQGGDGRTSMGEFGKILNHVGLEPFSVLIPLAHVQLARAAALAGDTARSRAAYDHFLSLWHAADGELSLLQAAKRERASLPE